MSDAPKPKRIDPQLLYGLSLLGGLAMSWPSFATAMRGESDIIAAGIRLLLSIAVVWTGGFFITSLIGGYAAGIPNNKNEPDALVPQRVVNTANADSFGQSQSNSSGFDDTNLPVAALAAVTAPEAA